MSTELKSNTGIWSSLGKAGMLVGLIWGGLQIYNYFFRIQEYEAEIYGNHSIYKTAPIFLEGYENSIKYKALVKTIIETDGSLKDHQLDKLISKVPKDYKYYTYDTNYSSFNKYKEYSWEGDYTSMWKFTIKNNGNKPLEELAIELPFKGYYTIELPNNKSKSDFFSNKIELGELRPSYEINIVCWSSSDVTYPERDEEKSRFTHKNGWFSINYPVEVSGLYAWNKKNNNMPLMFLIIFIIFILIISKEVGEVAGIEKQKKAQKIITELEENKTQEKTKNE